MSHELKELTQQMLPALNQEMQAVLQVKDNPPDLFHGMIHYHMGWVDAALNPKPVNSGKQIRPLLCLLTCQAAGGDWRQALPAAAAIEILHNFSLVHDDIEDNSPTRRGRDTIWKIWGQNQAINIGDTIFAYAHLALLRLPKRGVDAGTTIQALQHFDETCVALTRGQFADMSFETRNQVGVKEYEEMIRGKTAVLLSLSSRLGALIAEQNEPAIQHYANFGLELGLAFQIIDDILGIWGDETLTGKSVATDIQTKKKTLPILYGLEKSADLAELYQQSSSNHRFIKQVIELLSQNNAYEFSTTTAKKYSKSALASLEAAQPTGKAGIALHQLAARLLERNL